MKTIHAILTNAEVKAALAQYILQARNFRFHDGTFCGPLIFDVSAAGQPVDFLPLKLDIWVPTSKNDPEFNAMIAKSKPPEGSGSVSGT